MSRREKTPLQRILAMLLCVAMIVSFIPTASAVQTDSGVSAQADAVEYVSLPVTIRDFAADGMLFEFGQVDRSSNTYAPWKTYSFLTDSLYSGFAWGTNNSRGLRIRTYAAYGTTLPDSYQYWYCVICDSAGNIVKILPSGSMKADYATYMTAGRYAIWLWAGDGTPSSIDAYTAYVDFSTLVNDGTKHLYNLVYSAADGTLTVGVQYMEYNGKKYILGDNNGFTLQRTDGSDYINNLLDDSSIAGSQLVTNTTSGTTPPSPVTVELNSGAPQYVYGASMRVDLVAAELDKEKKPVYTMGAVTYLADLLQTMLQVPYTIELGGETYHTGYYILGTNLFDANFEYVGQNSDGAVFGLADVLRANINGGLGDYASSQNKFNQGLLKDPADADTYFDAAYYLLHSTWRDGNLDAAAPGSDGYGWNTWNYDKINLIQTTNANGEKCYVFNSGYDDVEYDYYWAENGTITGTGSIYNTQVEKITGAKYPGTNTVVYSNGIVLPEARFDPLGTSGSGLVYGYGQDAGTYCELLGSYPDRGEAFYPATNYHHTLEGHAKFIYYKDANQYFTFTGDDDVYLYINGKRVLDLGGAHSIAQVQINLNDVAQLCGLSDGMTYDFDFYYMERHGTAANFGIETNIQIVDPSMLTSKTGYQNGEPTGYNGYVNPNLPVVYEFGLENDGEAKVQELTFSDLTVGVSLTKDAISLNDLTTMDDLSVTLYNGDGTVKSSAAAGTLTEEALKDYLSNGLEVGEKIVIHGFSYKIGDTEWQQRSQADGTTSNWYFFNIIYTTATAVGENSSTRELTGTSNWVVQKLEEEKMGPLSITKKLGEGASHTLLGRTYAMQVLLDGKPLPVGTVYTVDGEDRAVETAGQILLGVDETAVIEGIAYGTAFQVRELIAEADRDVYEAAYEAVNATAAEDGVTGTITKGAAAAVTVTNHTKPGNLIETNKWVEAKSDPNKFTLTLESFVKGELAEVTTTTPSDIVLVLDQSASMYAPAGGKGGYDNSVVIEDAYSDSPDPLTASELVPEKAAHMGYYVAQSYSGRPVKQADGTTITYYDWFVVQYIDGSWYYVRKNETAMPAELDVNYSGATNVIGETLVRNAPIGSFHYYQSGYGALYDSVANFVEGLKDTGVDHRVAVVGFASPFYDAMEFFDGSGVYVNGEYYLYDTEYLEDETGIYTYTYKDTSKTKQHLTDAQIDALPTVGAETVYDQALVSVESGYDSIVASLNAVTTNYWHTCPAAGLDMANHIFEETPANGRNRTVVLFTDGVPTIRIGANYENAHDYTNKDSDGLYLAHVYWTVAQGKDNAMELAYETKNTYGAKIHAVGTIGAEGDKLFLSGISSEYPDAQAYPTTYTDETGAVKSFEDDGERQPTEEEKLALLGESAESKYTYFVTEELSLNDIFETILQSTTTLNLGADAVLREVLTDYFELDPEAEMSVKIYTADYNGDGTYAEPELRTEEDGFAYTLSSSEGSTRMDTIEITGFDYAGAYVSDMAREKVNADGTVNSAYYGSKLIVEVEIQTREGFWGGNNVPTNEDSTAIYEHDGTLVDKFPEPQVNVPLSLAIQAEDAVVYYGSEVLNEGLLTGITAGGLPVRVSGDTLTPQAEWMDDFATLTWTGTVGPKEELSTTETGDYVYSVAMVPNTDGAENTNHYPSNIAGDAVSMSGMSAADTSHVDVLVPVIPFQDSTIIQGDTPDENYFNKINLVDESIKWVLMEDIDSTKPATHGTAPELSFTYTHPGTFTEATPVDVTVKGRYGEAEAIDLTGAAYFDWVVCGSGLHDEGTIALHPGSTEARNEFWIHVTDVPDSGLVTDKYVGAGETPNEFELTLEAYALGQQKNITVTKPADIVLVLDHSGSMRTPAGASEVLNSQIYEEDVLKQEAEPYDGTAPALTKDQLDAEKGQHRGYYVAWSTSSKSWFVMEYDAANALWIGYSVPSTESIVNPDGWTEHTMTQSWSYDNLPAQFEYYKTQYAMLYDAVNEFVAELKASGTEHRVSIVGFAGPNSDGAGVYVNGEVDGVYEGFKYYKNLANNADAERLNKLYREAFKNVQNAADYAELLSAIEAIETNHSFTCPAAGLDLATDLYAANEVDSNIRDRIVVLFTDGIPNRMTSNVTDSTDKEIFNEIVEYAYAAKQQGATIYSISTTTLEAGEDRTFLHYASSDYPNAVDYDNPGSPIDPEKYTKRVENIDDFSVMFDSVTESITSTSVTLDEKAALKEVLTDYFVLNDDAEIDVEIYTAAYNGDGTFAAPVPAKGCSYKLSSSEGEGGREDTIEVTGFDYHDEYISNVARTVNGEDYYGSKLVVKVRIRTRDGFWGGNNVPTNEDATGIYTENGLPVEDFPEPEVNVPVEIEVVADDKTIYYGGDVTAEDLLESVTAGGQPVIIDGDTLKPQESWMDDYADLNWTADSTKPSTAIDNLGPKDYTFEVSAVPKTDGSANSQDDPSNIVGDPMEDGEYRDSDTGHVYVLVPEVTFQDSITAYETPVSGYDFLDKDHVSTDWVFLEDTADTTQAPTVTGAAPELTLTFTPEDGVEKFTADSTKVEVAISSSDPDGDISSVTIFKWDDDCAHGVHTGENGERITDHKANENGKHEFWVHVFRILPDTVVIDFGLSVNIDPLTNDLHLFNIDKELAGIGDSFANEYTGIFGSAKVLEGNEQVQYTLNTSNGMQMNVEEEFAYRGTYNIAGEEMTAESTITVIPATVIYYEDSFLTYKSFRYEGNDIVEEASAWTKVEGRTAVQGTDRPGADQISEDLNNIYGYDQAYLNGGGYSMDSYHQVTVDYDHYSTAAFTFWGTGFDVIALSSNTTGTIMVSVRDAETNERVALRVVDTYYGYDYRDDDGDGTKEWVIVDSNSPNALYQVPVMKMDLEEYGRYTAEITVSYAKGFDHEQYGSEGKYDFMLDAIRIYDQANDGAGSQTIEDAYKADGEGWPTYTELRNILIAADTFDSLGEEDEVSGIIFIDSNPNLGSGSSEGAEGPYTGIEKNPEIVDYANFGPNNELYLAPGQAVAFYLDVPENVQNVHLALKSVGGTAKVKVYDAADEDSTNALTGTADAAEVATATDLYYSINGLKNKTIIIRNEGAATDAILSVTNIKMTHAAEPVGQTEEEQTVQRFRISRSIAALALNALTPEPEVVATGWSGDTEWTLTDNGLLTFSGAGKMRNYTHKTEMTWHPYADQITKVVIGEGITRIGDYAFYGMDIRTIDIASTVTHIGDYAFKNAVKLNGVVLPEGLTQLGESAFYGCSGLTAIDIPAALWTVKPYTFKNCTALEKVSFHEGNLMKISDGAFYNTAITELVLPDCLDILDVFSFKNCTKLSSITLGAGLTEIREAAFYATAIPGITIPANITKVGPYAFKSCTALEAVDLGSVAAIGEAAFYGCTGLSELVIPDSVTAIDGYAFKNCTGLTKVTLGSGLKTIGESAFHTCTGLEALVIPANVERVGDYCFSGCVNLTGLVIENTDMVIGKGAFKNVPGYNG